MKRLLLPLVFALACVFLPSKCPAQGFLNHFNVYVTQSTDSTNTWFYQTITIDGYTQVAGMPSGVVHTPKIQNQLGSTGGWYTGTSVCPSCHITFSNTTATQPDNLIDEDTAGAEVTCTFGGIFFTDFFNFEFEKAYTRSKSFPPPTCVPFGTGQICSVPLGSWCTAATTPPDFNPTAANGLNPTSIPPFFDQYTICFRKKGTGNPWTCFPTVGIPFADNQLLAFCTHNP